MNKEEGGKLPSSRCFWGYTSYLDAMARVPTVLLLGFLLTASVPAQGQSADEFDRLFGRAMELHQAGDILGAIDNYKAALSILPERTDALSNLGAAYVRLGQFDDAIAQYEAALKVEPMNQSVRLNLALAFYKSARPHQAIPQLKRVLAADPEAKNAYLVLADCYLQTGEDKEVIALLKPREQMFAADLAYAYLLGTALLYTGDTDEGQKYADKVFGAGESAEAHLLLGIAMLARQDFRGAKTELEKAIELNPKLPTVNSLYGRSLRALGDHEAAERAFRRELQQNVNDFEANLQLGNLRKDAQKFSEASTYLERAVTIRPADVVARKLLASLRLQMGRNEEAVAILEGVVKDVPDLVDAHVLLATGYNRLKRQEDAAREQAIIDRLNAAIQAKQRGGDSDR